MCSSEFYTLIVLFMEIGKYYCSQFDKVLPQYESTMSHYKTLAIQ